MDDRPRNYNGREREVVFLTKNGTMEIRMMDLNQAALVSAAGTLCARFFITTTHTGGRHVYDLLNMSPRPGCIGPIKSFETDQLDAAVMYALSKGGM